MKRRIKVHKEGRLILLCLLFILFALNIIVYLRFPNLLLAMTTLLSGAVMLFFTYFFRNPTRVFEIDDPTLVVAPADGRVVVVETVDEHEYFGDKRIQISIFMSVFNVHANWYPIAGKVVKTKHQGRHLVAYLPKSSHENERSTIVIETHQKLKF